MGLHFWSNLLNHQLNVFFLSCSKVDSKLVDFPVVSQYSHLMTNVNGLNGGRCRWPKSLPISCACQLMASPASNWYYAALVASCLCCADLMLVSFYLDRARQLVSLTITVFGLRVCPVNHLVKYWQQLLLKCFHQRWNPTFDPSIPWQNPHLRLLSSSAWNQWDQ